MKLAVFALLAVSATAFQGPMTVAIGKKKAAPKKKVAEKPVAAAKKAPMKNPFTAAKKAPVAKKDPVAKKAPVAKKGATKAVVAKKAPMKNPFAVTKKAPAAKKAVVAKKAPVKKAPLKKKPVAKKTVAKKPPAPKFKGPKGPPLPPAGIDIIGAIPPAGFFDPAGFAKKATPEELGRYRECEIMHGRFAQLAVLGFLIPEKLAQGDNWGEDFLGPSNRALDVFETTPQLVILTLLLISALEVVRLIETVPGERTNAGIEGLGPRPDDPAEFLQYQLRELQNGRLAMLAFAGEVAQELVNGQDVYTTLDDIGIFTGKGLF